MQYLYSPTMNNEKWVMLELAEYYIVEIELSKYKDYANTIDNYHILIDPKIVDEVLAFVKDQRMESSKK